MLVCLYLNLLSMLNRLFSLHVFSYLLLHLLCFDKTSRNYFWLSSIFSKQNQICWSRPWMPKLLKPIGLEQAPNEANV